MAVAEITWFGQMMRWFGSFKPTILKVDVNEQALKHKGWRKRRVVLLQPGIRWYWPISTQVEGPFKVVPQPLTTSTINVMDKNGETVAARGYAVWKVTDLMKYAVENEDTSDMLDDLICAAIREVIVSKSIAEMQANSRKTIDMALLREVGKLTSDLGVEIQLVRLTTFTKTKVLSVLGDEAPVVDSSEDESEDE